MTLVTEFSALTWLYKSQNLSPKLHRWALRLMEYALDLQRKEGRSHHLPDALSRLPRFDVPGKDIDTSFPSDSSTKLSFRGREGPFLDGISLSTIGVQDIDYQDGSTNDTSTTNVAVVAALAATELFDEHPNDNPAELLISPEYKPKAVCSALLRGVR